LKEAAAQGVIKPKPAASGSSKEAGDIRTSELASYEAFLEEQQKAFLKKASTQTFKLHELYDHLKAAYSQHTLTTPAGRVESIGAEDGEASGSDADEGLFYEPSDRGKRNSSGDRDSGMHAIVEMMKADTATMAPIFKILARGNGPSPIHVKEAERFTTLQEWLRAVFADKKAFLPALETAMSDQAISSATDVKGMTLDDIKLVCAGKTGLVNLLRNAVATLNGETDNPEQARATPPTSQVKIKKKTSKKQ